MRLGSQKDMVLPVLLNAMVLRGGALVTVLVWEDGQVLWLVFVVRDEYLKGKSFLDIWVSSSELCEI